MERSAASVVLAALASVIAPGAVGAQVVRALTAPPEYAIRQWTTAEGLPQNSVNAIAQGPDGHLWLGTFGGLVRFDGTTFTDVERTDSTGRRIDRVLALAVEPDGALWIGTENGLVRFHDGAFRTFTVADGVPDTEITALHLDAAGVLWIGTARGGVARRAAGRFERVPGLDGPTLGRVSAIRGEADGTIWIEAEAAARGLERIPAKGVSWRAPPVADAGPFLLEDRAGARWFRVPGGLARAEAGEVRLFGLGGGIPKPSLMLEDARSGYWLGTGNDGLFHARVGPDSLEVERYTLPDGRPQFRVRSALVDRDGNVWIGTNANGLLRAKRNVFTTYSTAHGLSHDVATAVFQDARGTHWVGTNCGGVNALDLRRKTVRVYSPRSPNDPAGDPCIFALAEAPRGTVWQGTYGGGVSRVGEPRGGEPGPSGLPDLEIRALFTDRDGTLWVGTNAGGVAAMRSGRVVASYTVDDGLAHNGVRTFHQTRDGALWIGTLEGLSRLRDGRFTTFTAADGLSASHIRAIHEDAEGSLWIGTYGGGLNRLRDGRFTAVARRHGLPDDVVSSILEDGHGHFWMSGNRGIFRVAAADLAAFLDGRAGRVHAVLYGAGDGLRNAETNGGFQPAAWKDVEGRLWFPTLEGVAVVDPADVVLEGRPPPVAIEAVVVDGEPRTPGDAVVVGPGSANLEFRYTGLSLSAPEHLTFRFRLEGFDDGWVEAGTRRVAYYPGLRPGRYRFVVSAANRDGLWNPVSASLALRITPPFWSAWWFRLTGAAALLVLLAALLRRREALARRDRATQEQFSRRLIESQEHERKRIAGELHDGLGQELLIVKNRALLALRLDGMEARVREQLQHISSVVTGSLESVRELAHNLTPHQLDHLGLSAALEAMVEAVAETSGIRTDVRIENVDGLLPRDREINLYRIVQEGLTNVVRHSGSLTAAVHVRRAGDVIRIAIVDQGHGFSLRRDTGDGPPAGFGLEGMAERARILGGSLRIESAPEEGTRIELAIPIDPAVRAADASAAAAEPGSGRR